ncbi:unnamed protein product [Prorocentrum cordatum]|uniref:TerD domain-containing protein n=1 Tax=Prorocentrum cordatum TaxID=2364126 RepID=A0ABN9TZC9_9DINO|nr:unnamed protein product [Polarella glacialis]
MNGDDEAITIDLANVPDKVARIFIVLTVANGTFELVEHAYARVLDQHSSELVRFDIEASSAYRGLLVVQLFRSEGAEKRWGFQGLGRFFTCPGDWKSMANEITRVAADTEVAVDPAAVRQFNKTKSTKSHRSVEGAAAAPPGGQASDGEAQKAAATECMACGGAGCSMCRPTPTVREETLQPSSSSPIASRATGARLAIPGSFLSSTTGSQFFESNRASTEFASQRLGHGRLRLGRSTSNLKPNSLEQGGHMIVTTTPPTADRLMTDDSDVILVRPPDETDGERPRACRCFCGGT